MSITIAQANELVPYVALVCAGFILVLRTIRDRLNS